MVDVGNDREITDVGLFVLGHVGGSLCFGRASVMRNGVRGKGTGVFICVAGVTIPACFRRGSAATGSGVAPGFQGWDAGFGTGLEHAARNAGKVLGIPVEHENAGPLSPGGLRFC